MNCNILIATFSGGVVCLEVVVDAGVCVAVFERHDSQLGVDAVKVDTGVVVDSDLLVVTHEPRLILVGQLVAVLQLLQSLRKHTCPSQLATSKFVSCNS